MHAVHKARGEQPPQKSILVIEDDASVGSCLVEAISQETPWIAFLVTEGKHALQVMEEVKPDLIILDYLLPNMNGLDLYDFLHAHRSLADIPVVMISANLPQEEIKRRHLIGIHKPFELDDFLATLDAVLLDKEAK